MALGVLNAMVPCLWLYLGYWWNAVDFSSAMITFDRLDSRHTITDCIGKKFDVPSARSRSSARIFVDNSPKYGHLASVPDHLLCWYFQPVGVCNHLGSAFMYRNLQCRKDVKYLHSGTLFSHVLNAHKQRHSSMENSCSWIPGFTSRVGALFASGDTLQSGTTFIKLCHYCCSLKIGL